MQINTNPKLNEEELALKILQSEKTGNAVPKGADTGSLPVREANSSYQLQIPASWVMEAKFLALSEKKTLKALYLEAIREYLDRHKGN